jgi:hypothetical protein
MEIYVAGGGAKGTSGKRSGGAKRNTTFAGRSPPTSQTLMEVHFFCKFTFASMLEKLNGAFPSEVWACVSAQDDRFTGGIAPWTPK